MTLHKCLHLSCITVLMLWAKEVRLAIVISQHTTENTVMLGICFYILFSYFLYLVYNFSLLLGIPLFWHIFISVFFPFLPLHIFIFCFFVWCFTFYVSLVDQSLLVSLNSLISSKFLVSYLGSFFFSGFRLLFSTSYFLPYTLCYPLPL